MKTRKYVIIGAIALLVMCVIVIIWSLKPKPKVELRTETAQESTLSITVTATGYIQPVLQVEVGTQVSGIVERLYVDYNSEVKKGQLLAQLDKSTLNEQVLQCEAKYNDALSNLQLAQLNYDRAKALFDNKAVTLSEIEQVDNQLATANHAVANTKASLRQAKVNLSYADIYSPISGRVLNRAVDEGQTVAASFNTPTLFTIAHDLKKMQVEADIDEADIGRVSVGQPVEFTVDTYPGEKFNGTVSQIRLNPTTTSNVVTYVVIIEAPNEQEKLFPGMTANVTIMTQSSKGIVVSTEALYLQLEPQLLGDYTIIKPQRDYSEQIYILKGDTIACRQVVAGASDGAKSIIINGLQPGEQILLSVDQIKQESKESVSLKPKGSKPPREMM